MKSNKKPSITLPNVMTESPCNLISKMPSVKELRNNEDNNPLPNQSQELCVVINERYFSEGYRSGIPLKKVQKGEV